MEGLRFLSEASSRDNYYYVIAGCGCNCVNREVIGVGTVPLVEALIYLVPHRRFTKCYNALRDRSLTASIAELSNESL